MSAEPMVESIPDFTPGAAGDSVSPDLPEEFSRLGWTDSTGRRVYFSAGDVDADRGPLAESLVRALRGENTETPIEEALHQQEVEEGDPLFCHDMDEPDITAEELNNNLFGLTPKANGSPIPIKLHF
ncbi:hypothetical protein B0H10DRAFT_1889845 [Mycena sp. CBHHK59/15]|nr:hypothetical protein B0H10DRAFT_1889845 [Mycena sp. CBHHK59/15]